MYRAPAEGAARVMAPVARRGSMARIPFLLLASVAALLLDLFLQQQGLPGSIPQNAQAQLRTFVRKAFQSTQPARAATRLPPAH